MSWRQRLLLVGGFAGIAVLGFWVGWEAGRPLVDWSRRLR